MSLPYLQNTAAAAPVARAQTPPGTTSKKPEVMDDFLRNFFVKMGLSRTCEAFEAEWYELKATGRLDSRQIVPDIYLRNAELEVGVAEGVCMHVWRARQYSMCGYQGACPRHQPCTTQGSVEGRSACVRIHVVVGGMAHRALHLCGSAQLVLVIYILPGPSGIYCEFA